MTFRALCIPVRLKRKKKNYNKVYGNDALSVVLLNQTDRNIIIVGIIDLIIEGNSLVDMPIRTKQHF